MKISEANTASKIAGDEKMAAFSMSEGDVAVTVDQVSQRTVAKAMSAKPLAPGESSVILICRKGTEFSQAQIADILNSIPTAVTAWNDTVQITSEQFSNGKFVFYSGGTAFGSITLRQLYEAIRSRMANGKIAFDSVSATNVFTDDNAYALVQNKDGKIYALLVNSIIDEAINGIGDSIQNARELSTPANDASIVMVHGGSITRLPYSVLTSDTESVKKTGKTTAEHLVKWTPSGKVTDGPAIVTDLTDEDDNAVPTAGAVVRSFGSRVSHTLLYGGNAVIDAENPASVWFLMPDGWDGDGSTVRLRFSARGSGTSTTVPVPLSIKVTDASGTEYFTATQTVTPNGTSSVSVITDTLSGLEFTNGALKVTVARSGEDNYTGTFALETIEMECVCSLSGGEVWQ